MSSSIAMQTIPNDTSCPATAALDAIFLELLKLTPEVAKDSMTMNDVALWDSLRHMELITAIEQQFGFELSFDEISAMQTIGAIRKIVIEKTGA